MIRVTAPQLTVLHYVVSILLTKILRYYFVTYYIVSSKSSKLKGSPAL